MKLPPAGVPVLNDVNEQVGHPGVQVLSEMLNCTELRLDVKTSLTAEMMKPPVITPTSRGLDLTLEKKGNFGDLQAEGTFTNFH
ncbi:unnamed protein product [Pleuronectes platessa]|uniref:Uncharacterized protein n=1 Tax=Pleuronectes platessa TaxID=8262 RepID=A0A9N7UYA3_PLEPL|nr:unnamed protein product [Pleuronectes platessa]